MSIWRNHNSETEQTEQKDWHSCWDFAVKTGSHFREMSGVPGGILVTDYRCSRCGDTWRNESDGG